MRGRDASTPSDHEQPEARTGRQYIASIGIDHYKYGDALRNAANDAQGVLQAFVGLGFEPLCDPLIDRAATGDQLRSLVADRMSTVDVDDSLVVFFAGHGRVETPRFAYGSSPLVGFLVPWDGEAEGGRASTWLDVDSWITGIARLPARHVLIILDTCHSGISLGKSIEGYRGAPPRPRESMHKLRAKRSRRILTSALDDEVAADDGPFHGHSIFTGSLIEALTGSVFEKERRNVVTATEVSSYVRSQVISLSRERQTPDFGVLRFHDHGDLVLERVPEQPVRPSGPHEVFSSLYPGNPPPSIEPPAMRPGTRPSGPHQVFPSESKTNSPDRGSTNHHSPKKVP